MTTHSARIDGRAARAERTRDAVVEAFLILTDEGHLRPTARQIAERAGVSLRSVFQHFDDLETLFAAAADLQIERTAHLAVAIPVEAAFEERLVLFTEARGRLLEAISPVRRSALLGEAFSPEIARRLRWSRDMNRQEVERVFIRELSGFGDGERRLIAIALHSASDWYTWETLRAHNSLSFEDAIIVMSLTIRALLRKEMP